MAASATRPPNVRVAPQATLTGETPQFLSDLFALARAFPNRIFDVFSGYRSDAYSARVGGFAGDPHTRGIAADINVGGHPIGQVFSQEQLARYGLMSGNVPNFYKGKPDPSHLQLKSGGATTTAPASGGLQSSFAHDVAQATGLDWRVLFAWAGVEGAYGPHGTGHFNFLNIKGSGGAGTSPRGFAQYGSLKEAEAATVAEVSRPKYGILKTATKPAGVEIAAIRASPWDVSHEPNLLARFTQLFGKSAAQTYKPPSDIAWEQPGSGSGAGFDIPGIDIPNPFGGVVAWAEGFANLLAKLADPQFWIRVLEMLGGGVLLLIGLYLLTRQIGLPIPVGGPAAAMAAAA